MIQFNKTHCSVPINRFPKCHKKCSYELLLHVNTQFLYFRCVCLDSLTVPSVQIILPIPQKEKKGKKGNQQKEA